MAFCIYTSFSGRYLHVLKIHVIPFTLVLQIQNLRQFPIQYGLWRPSVSQIVLTEDFQRYLDALLGDA